MAKHVALRRQYLLDPHPRPMGVMNVVGRRSDGSLVTLDISLTPVSIDDHRWVVMLTASTADHVLIAAIEAGAAGFVDKSRSAGPPIPRGR